LLAAKEEAKAGRPPANRLDDTTDYRGAPTLRDLGISKQQSSDWQAAPDRASAPWRWRSSARNRSAAGTPNCVAELAMSASSASRSPAAVLAYSRETGGKLHREVMRGPANGGRTLGAT